MKNETAKSLLGLMLAFDAICGDGKFMKQTMDIVNEEDLKEWNKEKTDDQTIQTIQSK